MAEAREKPVVDLEMAIDTSATNEESLVPALTDEEVKSSIRQIGERLAAELGATSVSEEAPAPSMAQGPEEEPSVAGADVGMPEELEAPAPAQIVEEKPSIGEELKREVAKRSGREETRLPGAFGDRLRDVMDSLTAGGGLTPGGRRGRRRGDGWSTVGA